MKREDRRLHIAGAIACASTVAWVAGLNQQGRAFTGPEGMPSPVLSQLAVGMNLPALLIERFVMAVPILNEMTAGVIVYFASVALLWLWMFAWIKHLRGRHRLPLRGAWISIIWCALVSADCFYRVSDVDALRTFPGLISSAGFANAVVASSALQWHLTLLWGLFLAGSAVVAGIHATKAQVIAEVEEQVEYRQRALKASQRQRNRKHR